MPRTYVLLLFLLLLATPCVAQTTATTTGSDVPFALQNGLIMVDAKIKGDLPVVVVANLTPVARFGYRIGVPPGGRWSVVLSTDDSRWWGGGLDPLEGGSVDAEDVPWHGQSASLRMAVPPLSVVWLTPG